MSFSYRQLMLLIGTLVIGVVFTRSVLPATKRFAVVSGQDSPGINSNTELPRKPGEPEGFVPTPFLDSPLPPGVSTVEPGQPPKTIPRPSQEELVKLANPTPLPPDTPYQSYVVYDVFPGDSKAAAFRSNVIVLARVQQIHPAQWNTEDGKRPLNPYDLNKPGFIFTRISLKIEKVLSGDVMPEQELMLLENGGRIGNEVLQVESPYPGFAEGQTLLVYLTPLETSKLSDKLFGLPDTIWIVNERYAVDESTNIAINPFAQRILDELIAEINEVAQLKSQKSIQTP
jgi:hypothetical protein